MSIVIQMQMCCMGCWYGYAALVFLGIKTYKKHMLKVTGVLQGKKKKSNCKSYCMDIGMQSLFSYYQLAFRQSWFMMSCLQPLYLDHRYLWEGADAETLWGRHLCPQGWWAQRHRGHWQWGSYHPADCLRRGSHCQPSLGLSVSTYGFQLGPVFSFLLGAWLTFWQR